MSRFLDILWMAIGIAILIVVSTSGEIQFRYGVIGYIGAFACIGYGIKAIIDSYKERKELNRELLNNTEVENFYRNTKEAWADDRLKDLGSVFEQEGRSLSIKQLKKTYLPSEGSALNAFFTQFNLHPDEFLISMSQGTDNQENAWFVLTNRRLLQKNGETNDYREFYLKDIKEYGIDRQKAELSIKSRTGETVTLKNVLGFPKKKYMDVLIRSH